MTQTPEELERKQKEKAELELLLMDDQDADGQRKGFSLRTLVADYDLKKKGSKGIKALRKKLQRQGLGTVPSLH